ncbi:hypothetical protein [uncultured Methylobacterium sp.]|uniref:hypothetical protein n=1 Tax=uncultured Methylobacterium sp. TaxID=157278 RepID=UPI0035CB34BA
MAQNQKRPVQVTDARGEGLTSFAEGAISRFAVPNDGKWHRVPQASHALRLHVFPARAGVVYTNSKSAPVLEGDARAAHLDVSIPLAPGGTFTLTFADPTEVFVSVDPDAADGLAPPILGVVQSQMAGL